MLLPRLFRESLCWSKTSVLLMSTSECMCNNSLHDLVNSRSLHSFAKQVVCRKAPQRLGYQIRGVKGRRNPYTASQEEEWRKRNKTILTYIAAAGIGMIGMSYAAVPLYRLYCQATGLGGTAVAGHDAGQVESMKPVKDRTIKITFNADVHASMQWNFRPQQSEIYVVPGETALAFYKARNPTDKPVIGISTYNVVPFEAGQYFNKIQPVCLSSVC
ncbi:cytochrome c oxidase assembly protein COX11, mitochondrial isoform X2 [Megalops cyprinoides]|uniref:cytochrome c oxidase assembly protein COX11, mitochondrial isoform X2 n=1 Tax=Megalops cyprinoides TaxID=118141 RepID=UPI001863BC52|nr:cytochrome c oxidase assembly protein COX11, mitochondrial isoform X2 [Megalops cyprinoides]